MLRILLLDDDEGFRTATARCLRRAGHAVVDGADGSGALELCRRHAVELMITDIFMPGFDGLEAMQTVRKELPELRIIAISGGAILRAAELEQLAEAFGADEFLLKPFSMDELILQVSELEAEIRLFHSSTSASSPGA